MKTLAASLLAASVIAGCGSTSSSTSTGSPPPPVRAPSTSSFWELPGCLHRAGLFTALGSGTGSYLAVADADANALMGISYYGSVATAERAEKFENHGVYTDPGDPISASYGPVEYTWKPTAISEDQFSSIATCLKQIYGANAAEGS